MSEETLWLRRVIPGCTVDPATVSVGQMFALEYMFAQALIFVAFGVGLDPRQAKIFGAALAPFLVGLSLGLGTLASAFIKTGYTGLCELHHERLFDLSMIPDIRISLQSLKMLRSHGCERPIPKSTSSCRL